jgi:hypothetical protein
MAVIQYFIPGATPATICDEDGTIRRHELDAVGLAQSLRDLARVPRDAVLTGVRGGPGGGDGVLITPTRADGVHGDCCYRAEKQAWRQSENQKYWLGTLADEPIIPLDVQRRKVFLGYNVGTDELNQWLVPIARSEDDSRVTLPQDVLFVSGKPTTRLRKQYAGLWELATEIVAWCAQEETPAADRSWRIMAALTAINTNYRVWQDEVNLAQDLGCPILSTDILDAVCLSIADIQFAVEVKKKDLLESGRELFASADSTSGTEAGSNTAPVGAN